MTVLLLAGVQDCNLVFYSSGGTAPSDAIYSSGTYNQGAPPCQLKISSAGGGFFAVSDSKSAQLYSAPTPALVRQHLLCSELLHELSGAHACVCMLCELLPFAWGWRRLSCHPLL